MQPINVNDYEGLAQARLEPKDWDYYQGGSDDEVTLRANCTAFARIQLRPRMLVDVSECDVSSSVLGIPISMPVLVAPTASHNLAHPDGECITVQGVGAAKTLMIVSTYASRTLEDIAQAATGPLWFQLYFRSREEAAWLVQRAEAAGYRAIVLTVDSPRYGNRERDIHNNFASLRTPYANFAQRKVVYIGDTLTWEILTWLRSLTSLPLLVKGLLTAEDGVLAVEYGAAGIIVSNHGGRQLDSALPSIVALPEIVEAVAGRCEVYVDGGIRRGTDILKALALGARAVLVGRPILWGLASNGQEGVRDVLELLRAELEQAMILAGCPTVEKIHRSLIKYD